MLNHAREAATAHNNRERSQLTRQTKSRAKLAINTENAESNAPMANSADNSEARDIYTAISASQKHSRSMKMQRTTANNVYIGTSKQHKHTKQ